MYFFHVIAGTPFWVWIVLVYLLWIGIRSTKSTVVYLPRLFIIPLIMMATKYRLFFSNDWLTFSFAIILGCAIGFLVANRNRPEIIEGSKSIKIPGNYSTLILLLVFFCSKYYFGYLNATNHDLYTQYSVVEIIISGLLPGYFFGRAIRFMHKYFTFTKN
jgi:hypothetical protein